MATFLAIEDFINPPIIKNVYKLWSKNKVQCYFSQAF